MSNEQKQFDPRALTREEELSLIRGFVDNAVNFNDAFEFLTTGAPGLTGVADQLEKMQPAYHDFRKFIGPCQRWLEYCEKNES